MALKNQDGGSWSVTEDGRIMKTGEKKYSNGNFYMGEFIDGLKEGKGTMLYANGDKYVGSFKNDYVQGYGCMYYYLDIKNTSKKNQNDNQNQNQKNKNKGKYYEGMWFAGRKHGHGQFYPGNGDSYVGIFRKDLYHGKGVLTKFNGDIYEGEFYAGNLNGMGGSNRIKYKNGDYYQGGFQRGKFHFQGEFKWCTTMEMKMNQLQGGYYKGEYRNGKFHGKGSRTWSNGNHYEGYFEHGKPHGDGLMHYVNQDQYIGKWENGYQHGKGIFMKKATGEVYEGEFLQGIYHGQGFLTYSDGGSYRGDFGGLKNNFDENDKNINNNNNNDDDDDDKKNSKKIYSHNTIYPVMNAQRQGIGSRKFMTGDTYHGTWDEDQMHGKDAKLTKKDGGYYHGEYNRNKKEGTKCIETFGNAMGANFVCALGYQHPGEGLCKYHGDFKNNYFHGHGRYTCNDGKCYDGHFVNGERHGWGVQILSGEMERGDPARHFVGGKDGMYRPLKYVGDFENNAFNGWGCLVYPNGDRYSGYFNQNQLHGIVLKELGVSKRQRLSEWCRGQRIRWLDEDDIDYNSMVDDEIHKKMIELIEKSKEQWMDDLESALSGPVEKKPETLQEEMKKLMKKKADLKKMGLSSKKKNIQNQNQNQIK